MNILKITLILALMYLQGSMLLKQELSTCLWIKYNSFYLTCTSWWKGRGRGSWHAAALCAAQGGVTHRLYA